MTQTKLSSNLVLPVSPDVSKKEDLERYIRQLHKSLDEWYRLNRDDVDYAVEGTHEHDNKAILDAIEEALTSALKSAYDSAVADKHTHSNKATLDLITEAFTTALKSAYDEAVEASHSHSNATILDAIEEAFTTALKNAYDSAYSHSQQTSGNPHNVSKSDVGLGNLTNDKQVKESGDQTIYDVKTFNEFPITPSSAPTSDYQVANKKYVDDSVGGITGTDEKVKATSTDTTAGYLDDKIDTTLQVASNKLGLNSTLKSQYDSAYTHSTTNHPFGNVGTKEVDETDIGDDKILVYDTTSGKLIYENKPTGTTDEKVKASSTDPTAGYLDSKVDGSVVVSSNKLKLSGDSTSPGNSKYYGTDTSGTKGFFDLPSGGGFGAWTAKNANTVYQATTDGFVCAFRSYNDGGNITGYSDSNNPPTTIIVRAYSQSVTSYASITFPVRKNDYWKVSVDGNNNATVYWIPFGS